MHYMELLVATFFAARVTSEPFVGPEPRQSGELTFSAWGSFGEPPC